MLKGVAASPGIAIGKAYQYIEEKIAINDRPLSTRDVEAQMKVFEEALEKTKTQLSGLIEYSSKKLGRDKAKIFKSHLEMADDEELIGDIKENIAENLMYPDAAVKKTTEKFEEIFGALEDDYIKERITDIKDVCSRLIKNICGVPIKSLSQVTEEFIIIAKDLTPSDTVQLDKDMCKGFCTDIGSLTSHTAIMARTQEIPAVVGLSDITARVKDGDIVIVDGSAGQVCINPNEKLLRQYQAKQAKFEEKKQRLRKLINLPAETNDNSRRVELAANIGSIEDCENALANGAEGVGLFRTEFLYMDNCVLPSEEEQFEIYKRIAQKMVPHPVTIRTLDIGGDKNTPCIDMPEEMNPFLGWRAIRICLERTDIFKTQLRAILRAANYGNIRIMFPMISDLSEIKAVKQILNTVMEELDNEKIPYTKDIEIGIMIEIPSAAIAADILIQEVDFFSIGTNDLVQYTLAVDRMNERTSHLYKPFNIAILRLIEKVISVSHQAGKWTGMCGELAGCAKAVPILLGLGLDEFSMSASSLLPVKK